MPVLNIFHLNLATFFKSKRSDGEASTSLSSAGVCGLPLLLALDGVCVCADLTGVGAVSSLAFRVGVLFEIEEEVEEAEEEAK